MNKKAFIKIAKQHGIKMRYASTLKSYVYDDEKGNNYSKVLLSSIQKMSKISLVEGVKSKEDFINFLITWNAIYPLNEREQLKKDWATWIASKRMEALPQSMKTFGGIEYKIYKND